jgi:hypothetical protein
MTLLVADSEPNLLICALRCDVANQDRKLREAMAARAAGIENLGHERVCQAAATIIGQCRDRLDYPRAVEVSKVHFHTGCVRSADAFSSL